jgi:hypothetical protein
MNSQNDSKYYNKYLKYKSKYLSLKQSAGGFDWQDVLKMTFKEKGQILEEVVSEDKKNYSYAINGKQVFSLEIVDEKATIIIGFNNESSISSEIIIDILLSAFNDKSFISKRKFTVLVLKIREKLNNFFINKGFKYSYNKTSGEHVWTLDTNKVRII